MNNTSPEFTEMICRLQSGELTRKQAAAAYSIDIGTLNVWISRKGLADSIPKQGLAGAAREWAEKDPDKVKARREAAARVLSGEISAMAAAKEYPGMSHVTLALDVRKARIAQGLPVQAKRTRRTRQQLQSQQHSTL